MYTAAMRYIKMWQSCEVICSCMAVTKTSNACQALSGNGYRAADKETRKISRFFHPHTKISGRPARRIAADAELNTANARTMPERNFWKPCGQKSLSAW